ncbi:hypothetical protein TNCV_219271 [Trichonephila clavipes]|nr:hypothetical protein TNCV_219271 [Trichonephila clavipes]
MAVQQSYLLTPAKCWIQKFHLRIADYATGRNQTLLRKIHVAGSSGSMEPVGVFRMIERSKHLRKLQYSEYYGDGDSKAFEAMKTYAVLELKYINLIDLWRKKLNILICEEHDWPVSYPVHVKQTDSINCGVFIYFTTRILDKKNIVDTFDTNEFRKFMYNSITVVLDAEGGLILELDREEDMINENGSIGVNMLLVVESTSSDLGTGDTVAAIEEVDGKRCGVLWRKSQFWLYLRHTFVKILKCSFWWGVSPTN